MLPLPEGRQMPPPVLAQVQVQVSEAGKVSVTMAPPDASLGPALLTTIVSVNDPPAVTVVTPSVLVTPRSAWGENVSLSVAELLPGLGSVTLPGAVTVAVLVSRPLAADEMVQLAV